MYAAIIASRPAMAGYVRVRDIEDVGLLVKESEILTGRPGREFVIGGTERLAHRIHLAPNGYRVASVQGAEHAASAVDLTLEEFHSHRLGAALRAGTLFTAVLSG